MAGCILASVVLLPLIVATNFFKLAIDTDRASHGRDGDPEPIHLEETDTSFAIEWKGRYRIEGSAFVYADRDTGRVTTILGYPTQKIAQAG